MPRFCVAFFFLLYIHATLEVRECPSSSYLVKGAIPYPSLLLANRLERTRGEAWSDGMARRKRGRSGAVAHVARKQVGTRDDVTTARGAKKAERIGAAARIGGGLTDADAERTARAHERAKNGQAGGVAWREVRQVRAADALIAGKDSGATYRVGE